MEAKAIAKYVRISPLKVNFICSEIRGKQVTSFNDPRFTPTKGRKGFKFSHANAENNFNLDRDSLYILMHMLMMGLS